MQRAQKFWGRLGKIMRREGLYNQASEMFYREVLQVVLLVGLELWVMSAAMDRKVEGAYTRFRIQITVKRL